MTDTHQPAVVVTGVRKSFGETAVLDGVDLTVTEGTIFALLGPNGAGKTTIVRILSTLIPADSGDAQVAGHDVVDDPDGVRASIGVTGQFSAVDELLTGKENLQLMADLNHLGRAAGRARVDELLDRFDLVDAAARPVSTYSGGMRRRLDLAMTLIGSPRVIFLDEPTTGLDPRSRRQMWDDIRNLAAGGVTILLTTQYLDEADELADRIAVLDHGRIVAEGTPDELKRRIPGGHVRLQLADPPTLRAAAALFDGATPDEERLVLRVPGNGDVASLRHLLEQLDDARIAVEELSIHSPDLDDVFFAVTGHTDPRTGGSLMSTLAYTVSDSTTMLRRNLRRLQRYPSLTLLLVGMPIVFLLLFVYVFGGQLSHGLDTAYAAGHTGRAGYLNYVTPGILLMTVAAAVQGTAIVVAMDMTGGIIDRFRTMAIARSAVLTGHVLASLIQSLAQHRHRARRRRRTRLPPQGRRARLARRGRPADAVRVRAHLARHRPRPRRQERRDREQHTDVPHLAPLPRQRLRAPRLDADRTPPVRRVPAVHPRHRNPARTPHRNPDRHQRHHRRRLERRHRPRLLPLGQTPLHPQALGLTPAHAAATSSRRTA